MDEFWVGFAGFFYRGVRAAGAVFYDGFRGTCISGVRVLGFFIFCFVIGREEEGFRVAY